jgi:UDP-N-acetylglucosamine acyltransferase
VVDAPFIHPQAVIARGARLGSGVRVGPFAVIEDDTEVGDGCEISAHAVIKRFTRMGARNRVAEHAVIGGEPQDLKFEGWTSFTVIGTGNVIREGVTIHRASLEGGETRVGDGNYLMACSHVAHECRIGNQVIIANGALVAGFVTVDDHAFISGNVVIHQFVRVGRLALVGGLARVSQDCLPFTITEGSPARARAINTVGLKRAGVPAPDLEALKKSLALLHSGKLLGEITVALEASPSALVRELAQFIRDAKRGFTHPGAA